MDCPILPGRRMHVGHAFTCATAFCLAAAFVRSVKKAFLAIGGHSQAWPFHRPTAAAEGRRPDMKIALCVVLLALSFSPNVRRTGHGSIFNGRPLGRSTGFAALRGGETGNVDVDGVYRLRFCTCHRSCQPSANQMGGMRPQRSTSTTGPLATTSTLSISGRWNLFRDSRVRISAARPLGKLRSCWIRSV